MSDFVGFGKIPRLSRRIVVTEKIDGTNAQIFIDSAGNIRAGSRKRWITPADDNYGFARWVDENSQELLTLGEGRHFGEWWGAGIQRRYGISGKRFSLFNSSRWSEDRPSCCDVVPVLYDGEFDQSAIDLCLHDLRVGGSVAAPGFDKPEGVVIYHVAADHYYKKTILKDAEPKGLAT